MFVSVFEVFLVTHQWYDDRESQFAIMFREYSQIDFAIKENVILNVSLRPSLTSGCTFHFKTDSQFMC